MAPCRSVIVCHLEESSLSGNNKALDGQAEANPARDSDRTPVTLSIVAPCYNEEAGLEEFHGRVSAVCRKVIGDSYEIVLINDGSRDGTWSKIRTLAHSDPRVLGVNLARNHGHQLALSAGLTVCRGDRVLAIDADLQDPPELLGEMMRMMDEGADVVYGQRTERAGETWFKSKTAHLFYRLLRRLVDIEIPIDTGDFRLMSRRALNILNAMPKRNRYIRGMVSWIGLRQVPIRYSRHSRFAGSTGYPFRKMILLAVDAITGFSVIPLRLAAFGGMALGVLGLVFVVWVIVDWATGNVVRGWTSVMSIVLIIGSVQLLVLGIFGEYLGRMFFEVKRRPLFVIDEVVTASDNPTLANRPDSIAPPAAGSVRSSGVSTSSSQRWPDHRDHESVSAQVRAFRSRMPGERPAEGPKGQPE
jgi:polyisoprenyl-phosphate glycosyltransferase